jgi:hypothetical protein
MALTFEALVGSLKMDVSDWQSKIPVAQRQMTDLTNKVTADAKAMESQVGGAFQSVGSAIFNAVPGLNSLGGGLAALNGGAALLAGTIAGLAAAIGVKAVQAASEAEQVAVRLDSVLRATGNTTGLTRDEMEGLAESIQRTTQFEDEAALGAMSLLASMKEIKGDVFRDVMTTAADMAVVLGTDLTGAAELLGRALVDPEQAATRLMRAGIHLSDQQREQVAAFMEMNDAASAQRVILDELASRYGGAAKDQADTLAGSFSQLWNEVGNLLEAFGDAGLTAIMRGVVEVLKAGTWWTSQAVGAFKWLGEAIYSPYTALLKLRIAWNDFWGDVEEAKSLKQELDWLTSDENRVNDTGDATSRPAPKPATTRSTPKPGATASQGGSRAASRTPAPEVRPNDQGTAAGGTISFHSQFLAQATPEQAKAFVKSLNAEIAKAARDGGLSADWANGTVNIQGFEKMLDRYEARLKLMPGFNAQVWGEVESITLNNLRMAAHAQGEMRDFYLKSVDDTMSTAERMFTDAAKKADDAKRKAEELAEHGDKAKAVNQQGAVRVDAKEQSKTDPFAWMLDAKKGDLTKRLGEMKKQWGQSRGLMEMIGIGTPEQRRGLSQFQAQMTAAMKAVRDSTGETRAANIEQLRQLEAAWAKAFEEIRNGSKKTVEELVADAGKQGDAGQKAAQNFAKGATSGGGVNAFSQVAQMSRELTGLFTTALSGFGAGMLGFQQLLAETTDPAERLGLLTDNLRANMEAVRLNAQGFAGAAQAGVDFQRRLLQIEQERQKAQRQAALEAEEAVRRQEESYREKQREREQADRDRRREQGLDLAGAIAVGKVPPMVLNINGVNDVRQAVDNLEKELVRRGINRGGKKKFETPR